MSISQEFILSLFIQLLILAFFFGVYVTTVKFMGNKIEEIKEALKEDKAELKEEMKRYNGVLERMIITEQSTKSAHHRIDELERRG